MPDAYLDPAAIGAATFVRHVEIHDRLGSTNDRAVELARDPHIELPALVAAHCQTAGRGRGSNKWLSSEGALTFSVLLEPASLGISTANWPQLSLAAGVALCDAISRELRPQSEIENPQSPRLAIKWPNDVMLDGAKVCGILIESPGGPAPAKDRLVIGIGINVNNSWRNPDPSAQGVAQHGANVPNAAALCDATDRKHNLQQLLGNALCSLETRINQLAGHDSQLPEAWQRLCWLAEQNVEIQTNSQSIRGICLGIDADGALLVKEILETHRICSGSVRVV